ncbi:MAG: hypothetical protein ACLFWD_11460 [Anaerolineales bacterium]
MAAVGQWGLATTDLGYEDDLRQTGPTGAKQALLQVAIAARPRPIDWSNGQT